jgi:HSP20 family protein
MAMVRRTPERGLVRWDPFSEMREFERRFHGTLGDLFDWRAFPTLWSRTLEEGARSPSIEVVDKGDKYLVRAELPGMKKEDIDVSIADSSLTISGERKQDKEVKEEDYLYREHYYGSFHRTLPLPEGVDSKKIEASYENGILEVTMPKGEETKIKKVKVGSKGEKK